MFSDQFARIIETVCATANRISLVAPDDCGQALFADTSVSHYQDPAQRKDRATCSAFFHFTGSVITGWSAFVESKGGVYGKNILPPPSCPTEIAWQRWRWPEGPGGELVFDAGRHLQRIGSETTRKFALTVDSQLWPMSPADLPTNVIIVFLDIRWALAGCSSAAARQKSHIIALNRSHFCPGQCRKGDGSGGE